MKNTERNIIILDAETVGLRRLYVVEGEHCLKPSGAICFQCKDYDEAVSFARKHNLSVHFCYTKDFWRVDLCEKLYDCTEKPLHLEAFVGFVLGNGYEYFSPESVNKKIEELFSEVKNSKYERERAYLLGLMGNFIKYRERHLVTDYINFYPFDSCYLRKSFYDCGTHYFYGVILY